MITEGREVAALTEGREVAALTGNREVAWWFLLCFTTTNSTAVPARLDLGRDCHHRCSDERRDKGQMEMLIEN